MFSWLRALKNSQYSSSGPPGPNGPAAGPPTTNGPGGAGRPPANPANIQKMLDENSSLIKTISDYQNMGKHAETMSYQWQLHRNLMYLAQMADANQNLQNLLPPPGQVPPPGGMPGARPPGPGGPPGSGPPSGGGPPGPGYGPGYNYGAGGPRPGYGGPGYPGGGPGYNGPERGQYPGPGGPGYPAGGQYGGYPGG